MAMTFSVAIDWTGSAWVDESAYVRRVKVRSGFDRAGEFVAGGGSAVIVLDNSSRRFSPGYPDSPLYGDLTPRRPVRVQASDGVNTWTLFRGFIERIVPDAGFWSGKLVAINCVDAMTLLGQQRVSVAHEDSKPVDEAISSLVASVYTPPATSYNDNGDELTHYGRAWQPEHTSALQAVRDVAAAVYGRFFVARDGTVTFRSRDQLQDSSAGAVATLGDPVPTSYTDLILATESTDLLALWPLWETAGAVAHDLGASEHDALASGVSWDQPGLGDAKPTPFFDGINDTITLPSAFYSTFSGAAGTLAAWVKLAAGAASDGQYRFAVSLGANISNRVVLYKSSASNFLGAMYYAGGVGKGRSGIAVAGTGWHHLAITWDAAADEVRAFLDGLQYGGVLTGLGSWAGTIGSSHTAIGSLGTSGFYWHGGVARVAVWDTVLSAAQIAELAAV